MASILTKRVTLFQPRKKEISGVNSITLENPITAPISKLVVEGECTQTGTPSPSAPVDIECNNGTLVPKHESGLPLGYTLLDSIGCNSSRDIITPIYLANTDVVECRFRNSTTTGYGALYGTFAVGDSSAFYANGTYYGYNASNSKVDTEINVDDNWHTLRHDFINGEITIDEQTTTFAPFTFTNSKAMHIFSRYYNNSYGYYWKGYISYFRVYRNGELICDYIPAKYNDNVGVYDLVNEEFLYGTNILEGSTIDDPVTVVTTGTPNTVALNSQIANVADLLAVGNYKDEQDIISGDIIRRVGVKVLDGTENWTINVALNTNRFRLSLSDAISVTDRYQIICSHFGFAGSGQVEGICFIYTGTPTLLYFIPEDNANFSTVGDWTAYLAAQYAAGTPVIVLYPLATSTTEQVAAQPFKTKYKFNTIINTNGAISAKYWQPPF